MAIGLVLIPARKLIAYLKLKYIGQYIREDGPQAHQSKKGTPTMGGLLIISSITITSIFELAQTNYITTRSLIFLLVIIGFALLGFMDDYLKISKKHNKGVTGWTKLLAQTILALIIVLYMFLFQNISTVNFFGLYSINLSYFYILFGIFVIIASSNAINLTDGLDGLASLTCSVSFFTLSYFLYKTNNLDLALISCIIGGSCFGFLFFNYNPAKIFMGDVGSLMLGGAFGALGVLGKLELWLIPIGIIFVIETLSVIIQVISFQSTGKRVFKMTPLHHHFELLGEKEISIVWKFTTFQFVSCIIALVIGCLYLF